MGMRIGSNEIPTQMKKKEERGHVSGPLRTPWNEKDNYFPLFHEGTFRDFFHKSFETLCSLFANKYLHRLL
jgi:hypothetical protein